MAFTTSRTTPVWAVLTALSLWLPAQQAAGQEKKADPWEPVRFLLGDWEGTAEGEAGIGTVERSYSFETCSRPDHHTPHWGCGDSRCHHERRDHRGLSRQ